MILGPKLWIYQLGGVDVLGGQVSPLDHRWLKEADGKPICIVDLTGRDAAKRPLFRSIMAAHFSKLTDSRLVFISEQLTQPDVYHAFANAGAIYFPGGDTEALLENLAARNLCRFPMSSGVTIVGNSAGALALGEEVVLTTDADNLPPRVLKGLGAVTFAIDPHYDPDHDAQLLDLSARRVIYGLPEGSAIISEGYLIEFFGPVWGFADGFKERLN